MDSFADLGNFNKLGSSLVLDAGIHNVFIIQKMKKCEVDLKKGGCSSKIGRPGIFAMISKISLGLRKFRNHSENFAM